MRAMKYTGSFVRAPGAQFDWPALRTSLIMPNNADISTYKAHSTIAIATARNQVDALVQGLQRFLSDHIQAIVPTSDIIFMVREALTAPKQHAVADTDKIVTLVVRAGTAVSANIQYRVFFAEEEGRLYALVISVEFVGGKKLLAHVDAMVLAVGESFTGSAMAVTPEPEYVLV